MDTKAKSEAKKKPESSSYSSDRGHRDSKDVIHSEREHTAWKTLIPFRPISKQHRGELPVEHVGLVSFLLYGWFDGLMWRAFRRPGSNLGPVARVPPVCDGLTKTPQVSTGVENVIWTCPQVDSAEPNADRLERLWKQEVADAGSVDKALLKKVFLKFIKKRCIVGAICQLLAAFFLLFSVAYIMRRILIISSRGQDDSEVSLGQGLVLVIALFTSNMLSAIFFIATVTITQIAGGRLRSGMLLLLYRRLLLISSLKDETIGKILNLCVNDGQRLYDGVTMLPVAVSAPLLVVGSTGVALWLIGPWALIGLAVLLLLVPLQGVAGKFFMKFRGEAIIVTDKRVRMMTEYLANVRFIKLYSWESSLTKMVKAVREQERRLLVKLNLAMSYMFLTSGFLVAIATMLTIIAYTMTGHHLNPVQAFLYLLIYTCIQDKLELCMLCIKNISELFVAAARFQKLLGLSEKGLRETGIDKNYKNYSGGRSVDDQNQNKILPEKKQSQTATEQNCIAISQALITWSHGAKEELQYEEEADHGSTAEEKKPLTDDSVPHQTNSIISQCGPIDLHVKKGSLVTITGPVGSGKTALLQAILGEMNITEGNVTIHGKIAYVPQDPWIFSGTVQQNILFGANLDVKRYGEILEACCLITDLHTLPHGDATEIGERGVTLSGGQKLRISLARALYSDRDLYVLDDPLSAVDPDIAQTLFQRVVLNLLKDKTVVLVTHRLECLQQCYHVVYMKDGKIVSQGTHELMTSQNDEYAQMCSRHLEQKKSKHHSKAGDPSEAPCESIEVINSGDLMLDLLEQEKYADIPDNRTGNYTDEKKESTVSALIGQEEKTDVTAATFRAYINSAGGIPAILVFLLISVLAEGSRAFSHWWLAYWLEHKSKNVTKTPFESGAGNQTVFSDGSEADKGCDVRFFNSIYAVSLIAILFFFSLRSVLLIKLMMRASSRLHDKLFSKVIRAPIQFFDSTPLGRILNRFSKDMDEIDSKLPMYLDNTMKSFINIIIYLILISIILPWFLLAIPPTLTMFVLVFLIFQSGFRELQRRNLTSLSPVLTQIDITLRGLTSIRVYDKSREFKERFVERLNENTVLLLLSQFATRWLSIRLSLLTNLLVSSTALIIILLSHRVPPGYSGAAIVYAFQLLTLFQFLFRFAVDSLMTSTSTERIRYYAETLDEETMRDRVSQTTKKSKKRKKASFEEMPPDWPMEGRIDFRGFSLRYRCGGPPALDKISLNLEAREKIGIVGRTGAGKTSLASSLFRLVEGYEGSIEIDGVDISTTAIDQLRACLTIIPQDPVLFSGTIRSNLDPFYKHSDEELWSVLEQCQLKKSVIKIDEGLLGEVLEGGRNLSQGERQLLALARALLRRTKIVILDEATAYLDHDTEEKIQTAMREAFVDCTVLIIAHRLKTVLRCDRVIVMGDGKVQECGSPTALMRNENSLFYQMIHTTKTAATTSTAPLLSSGSSTSSTTAQKAAARTQPDFDK